MRRLALLAAALTAVAVAPAAHASSLVKAPVVAVIDSGINAQHQEFGAHQLVGFWDFTAERRGSVLLPRRGQRWDTIVPYDSDGHGTLTASMVAGLNVSPDKTPSADPGGSLAVAKVLDGDGGIHGDLAAAVAWAVGTVHADVISLSIGTDLPEPAGANRSVYDAIEAARKAGVLVVVSNGNGYLGTGQVPGDPGWASSNGSSPYALSVGADHSTAVRNSTDPEVTGPYGVTGASSTSDTGYVQNGGTSFSAAYVAGFAAAVLQASRSGGHPLSADALELFVKRSSLDTSLPPDLEGYGVLNGTRLGTALADARAGRTPVRPSPDLSAVYVEDGSGSLRKAWTRT